MSDRPMSFREIQRRLDEALRCVTCGKATSVKNLAGHRQRPRYERVTRDTHCSCPGGPAHREPQP